jgi:hypothetical protein
MYVRLFSLSEEGIMLRWVVKFGFAAILWAGVAGATPLYITAVNSPSAKYPYIGGIRGMITTDENLGAGSSNYVYLGGTVFTPAGAPPMLAANSVTYATGFSEEIESSIWSIDPGGVLGAQWVNTDLSRPATYILLSQGALILTGDKNAFTGVFGPAMEVKLTYIPTSGSEGYIKGTNALTSEDFGALGSYWTVYGEYGGFTNNVDFRLSVAISDASAVPEPSTLSLMVVAAGIFAFAGRRGTRRGCRSKHLH